MTEEKFKELFGENENLYIKISDLKEILVNSKDDLLYDFLEAKKDIIWGDRKKTYGTTLRAFGSIFGKGWEDRITFSDLSRDFKKFTYHKGIGKVALKYIVKMYKMKENKITPEMYSLC